MSVCEITLGGPGSVCVYDRSAETSYRPYGILCKPHLPQVIEPPETGIANSSSLIIYKTVPVSPQYLKGETL